MTDYMNSYVNYPDLFDDINTFFFKGHRPEKLGPMIGITKIQFFASTNNFSFFRAC